MRTKYTKYIHHLFGVLALLLAMPATAQADILQGRVLDALTGLPIPGAAVKVLGTKTSTLTDDAGKWQFDLPEGKYELQMQTTVGNEIYTLRLVNQYVPQYKPATMRVYTSYFMDMGHPALSHPWGVPGHSGKAPAGSPPSLPLTNTTTTNKANPLGLTVPDTVPRRIRVGRRARPTEGCRDNPIVAIEEMDIDEYVKGVLPPEIGVFRSLNGAAEVYKEFAIAAKSYGLWFIIYYDADNRRTTSAKPPNNYTWFHIDDTACNQRYSDERLTITTMSAEAVANKIMVKKGDPNVLDKLEYAASCGKHGTLPEYGDTNNLVPDNPNANSCVGSWCGHNRCAGHQDNPNLAGDDRCLVRGICQWGSANWGEVGKDYQWMIAHYQPNLEIRDLSQSTDPVVTVTGYAFTDPNDITNTGLANVDISLSDGQSTKTDAQGVYTFNDVKLSLGKVTVTAQLAGYQMASKEKPLEAGQTNWASLQMVPLNQPIEDMGMMTDMSQDMSMDMGGGNNNDMSNTPDMPNTGEDMTNNNGGRLDNLVNESPGIDGGCGCGQSPTSPAMPGLLLMVFGVVGLYRRRK